jgi:dCTP diphosphatase
MATICSESVEALLNFRRERDWERFHTPKNLAIAISVEAAELLEHFQWSADSDVQSAGLGEKVRDEIADVAILLIYLAHDLKIDLDAAVRHKLEVNRDRYPVETSRGNARKHGRT